MWNIPSLSRRLTVYNPGKSVPEKRIEVDLKEQEEKIKKLQREFRENGTINGKAVER